MTLRAALVGTMLLVALAACGGHDERLTVYLRARLGPEGPHGQIAPVLTPVERDRRAGISAARQAILDVRTGPSPDERAHGFLDTIGPQTRLRDVRVREGVATVDLLGHEPDFYASAAIVYSLTELDGVDTVRLRLDGRPCCFHRHDGQPISETTRASLRGWQGQPCALRTGDDPPCRS
jgi:hypothetical protein